MNCPNAPTNERSNQQNDSTSQSMNRILDYGKIKKNPGLCLLAKLMLNSFCKYHFLKFENDFSWLQSTKICFFSLKWEMPQVGLVKDTERYFQLLTCQLTQVINIQFVNEEWKGSYQGQTRPMWSSLLSL